MNILMHVVTSVKMLFFISGSAQHLYEF